MFERFTERARHVVVLASDLSHERGLKGIGTVALLVGMIREGGGIAARVLAQLGVTEDHALTYLPCNDPPTPAGGHLPFTADARKSLELVLREALQLGHNYIGTEHLLLALIRNAESDAASVITERTSLNEARQTVIRELAGYPVDPGVRGAVQKALDDAFTVAARERASRFLDALRIAGFEVRAASSEPGSPAARP